MELHEGDRVCLIGHNGAGKTTLLRVLAGIYPASTGKVEVLGKVFALLGNSMMMNADATGYTKYREAANRDDRKRVMDAFFAEFKTFERTTGLRPADTTDS